MDDIKGKVRDTYGTASDRVSRATHALRGKEESHVFGKAVALAIGVGIGIGIGVLIASASGAGKYLKLLLTWISREKVGNVSNCFDRHHHRRAFDRDGSSQWPTYDGWPTPESSRRSNTEQVFTPSVAAQPAAEALTSKDSRG